MTDNPITAEVKKQRELASTEIGAVTARVMVLGFVLIIGLPGPVQVALNALSGASPFAELRVLAGRPDGARFRAFEKELDRGSVLRNWVQPRLQESLSGFGKVGNEKVSILADGWLFYAPGLKFLSGAPFLDPDTLALRTKNMVDKLEESDPSPDPRPALFGLVDFCQRAGLHLVFVPVPDKGAVEAERLRRRPAGRGVAAMPSNASFEPLVAELRARGATVFTDFPEAQGERRFLRNDTHWRPEYMEEVAARLARSVGEWVPRDPGGESAFSLRRLTVRHDGDLVTMLKLTPAQRLFAPEEVPLNVVVDARTGLPVAPDPGSPVLLLGDSFCNIYSSSVLGWGEGAGLPEHLAYRLRRPVDVIALNGAGAVGIRVELARASAQGRLAGKKVLVYEFAARDLALESWRPVELVLPPPTLVPAPSPAPVPTPNVAPVPAGPTPVLKSGDRPVAGSAERAADLEATIEVVATSQVPRPGTAPYRDCLVVLRCSVREPASSPLRGKTVLIALWGMRDDAWTEAASYQVGDLLEIRGVPFRGAPEEIRAARRADDTQDYESPMFWVRSAVRRSRD
jgi:SGNH hydrolase-like domain, acetyltransferase AlgX